MKRIYNALFFFIALIAISLAVYCFSLKKQLDQKVQTENQTVAAIQAEAKIIARKVDKEGLEHVTITAAGKIIPQAQVKAAKSEGILDTTAMALNIQKKQIENLLVINSQLKAEKLRAIEERDALNNRFFSYQDKHIKAKYTPPANPSDSTDKGSFDFQYDSDLTVTQYWKRSKVLGLPLGGKHSYIDIYSNDKRATIRGSKKLTIMQEQPWLGLRVQGVSNFQRGMILPGAGIQFDAGRFSVQGSYLYDAHEEQWIPSISGRYDLIRF